MKVGFLKYSHIRFDILCVVCFHGADTCIVCIMWHGHIVHSNIASVPYYYIAHI